jgi:hypothetical protein
MKRQNERVLPFPAESQKRYLWTLLCGLAMILAAHFAMAQDLGSQQRLGNTDSNTQTKPAAQKPAASPATTPASSTPSGTTQSTTPAPDPNNPTVVNQTGGIINSHPEDLLNQPRYLWPEETRQQSNVIQVPAPEVVNITGMNQNAASIGYQDRGSGPFTFAVESTGIFTTNLYNQFTNAQAGGYFDVGLPVRFYLASPRTNLGFFSRTNLDFYPGNTQLNHYSTIFSVDLNHRASALTDWSLEFAGGRTTGVGTYLSPVIPIGTTGVAQPGNINGLEPTYNLAAVLGVTHRLSDTDRIVTSITGAWLEQPLGSSTELTPNNVSKTETAGLDVHYQHANTARSAIGLELTDIFVRGITPVGHSNYTSVKGTYQYSVSERGILEVGFGPLFSLSNSEMNPSTTNFTYAANASFNYQTPYGKIGAGYARVVQLGYLLPSSAGNQFFGVYDRPLNRYADLTADASYLITGSQEHNQADYTDLGLSARLNFNFTRSVVFYVGTSLFHQDSAAGTLAYEDASVGITYTFGSSLARKGAR